MKIPIHSIEDLRKVFEQENFTEEEIREGFYNANPDLTRPNEKIERTVQKLCNNSQIKDIHSREELEDFIQKTVGKKAIPELVEKILSFPSGEIITFVCRQYDPVLGHRQQSIRVFHKLG